jgi:hypothetical protein
MADSRIDKGHVFGSFICTYSSFHCGSALTVYTKELVRSSEIKFLVECVCYSLPNPHRAAHHRSFLQMPPFMRNTTERFFFDRMGTLASQERLTSSFRAVLCLHMTIFISVALK